MEPKKETKQGSKHVLLMVLCCLAPMLLVVLLFTVGIGGILPFLLILLCPLMHFVLMRGMHGKHDRNKHSGYYVINTETNAKRLKQTDNSIEPAKLADAKCGLQSKPLSEANKLDGWTRGGEEIKSE